MGSGYFSGLILVVRPVGSDGIIFSRGICRMTILGLFSELLSYTFLIQNVSACSNKLCVLIFELCQTSIFHSLASEYLSRAWAIFPGTLLTLDATSIPRIQQLLHHRCDKCQTDDACWWTWYHVYTYSPPCIHCICFYSYKVCTGLCCVFSLGQYQACRFIKFALMTEFEITNIKWCACVCFMCVLYVCVQCTYNNIVLHSVKLVGYR